MDLWMATPVNAAIAEAALLMHRCPGLEKFNIDISVVQRRITWGSIFIQKKTFFGQEFILVHGDHQFYLNATESIEFMNPKGVNMAWPNWKEKATSNQILSIPNSKRSYTLALTE